MKQAGTNFGLHLVIDVHQYDYSAIGYRAGLRVLIHHHETPPLVSQLGFAVGPGTSTFAAINKQRVRPGTFLPYETKVFLAPGRLMFPKTAVNRLLFCCFSLRSPRIMFLHSVKLRLYDGDIVVRYLLRPFGHFASTCCDMWVLLAQVWNWWTLNHQHPKCRNKVPKRSPIHLSHTVVFFLLLGYQPSRALRK